MGITRKVARNGVTIEDDGGDLIPDAPKPQFPPEFRIKWFKQLFGCGVYAYPHKWYVKADEEAPQRPPVGAFGKFNQDTGKFRCFRQKKDEPSRFCGRYIKMEGKRLQRHDELVHGIRYSDHTYLDQLALENIYQLDNASGSDSSSPSRDQVAVQAPASSQAFSSHNEASGTNENENNENNVAAHNPASSDRETENELDQDLVPIRHNALAGCPIRTRSASQDREYSRAVFWAKRDIRRRIQELSESEQSESEQPGSGQSDLSESN